MKTSRIRAYCQNCKHEQDFVRYTPHHGWHLVMSLLTVGLWLVSWISVCIGAWFRPWRCKVCGWHEPQLKPPGTPVPAPKVAKAAPESSPGKA